MRHSLSFAHPQASAESSPGAMVEMIRTLADANGRMRTELTRSILDAKENARACETECHAAMAAVRRVEDAVARVEVYHVLIIHYLCLHELVRVLQ